MAFHKIFCDESMRNSLLVQVKNCIFSFNSHEASLENTFLSNTHATNYVVVRAKF